MSDVRREDDDDDLGLDLSSMRSMFRELRDEEPSDKGMAALLSAAREKAEEMKPKRSWFAALLDQLRRPPVLAMATVVVLIGGAVVISRRDDMKTDVEMAAPAPVPTVAMDKSVAPPGASDEAEGGRHRSDVGGGEATGSPTVADEGAVAPEAPVVTQRPKPTTNKPPRVPGPRTTEEKKPADSFALSGDVLETAPEPKKEDAKAPLAIATSSDEDLQPKGGAAPIETSTTAPPPDHKSVSRKPLPSIEGEDRAAKDSSIAQLVKQCEAAAAKNDCAAVRSIAAKIAKQDPQTYKNRVLKNAGVTRCLAPPAPMEAAPIDE